MAAAGREVAEAARGAMREAQALPAGARSRALAALAGLLEAREADILAANAGDVARAGADGTDQHLLQRLGLKSGKIGTLARGIRAIAAAPEPLGRPLRRTRLAEGLVLEQVTAPLGVLLVVFEARPDALPQIAALAVSAGNGLILKGGKEARDSNRLLHGLVVEALGEAGLPPALVQLVEAREEVSQLLSHDDCIDLVIPRGSGQLVRSIQANTKIPVMGHADGVCHIFVDRAADLAQAVKIVVDAKVDYPAACNAVETVLLHADLLPRAGVGTGAGPGPGSAATDGAGALLEALRSAGVEVFGGPRAVDALGLPPAPELKHEWGDLRVTVEVVDGLEAAVAHIHAHGSAHTDGILTTDMDAAERFVRSVDSACVFVNASTRFADGFRFGLGAEVSRPAAL